MDWSSHTRRSTGDPSNAVSQVSGLAIRGRGTWIGGERREVANPRCWRDRAQTRRVVVKLKLYLQNGASRPGRTVCAGAS